MPQSQNPYQYSYNNPINLSDPSGMVVYNNSDQYILVKDETNVTNPYSALNPHTTYPGSQDGVIFQDGSIYKNNDWVNINVANNGVSNAGYVDNFIDNVSNAGKAVYNLLPASNLEQSGWYNLNDGSSTGNWAPGNSLNNIRTSNNNACWR